MSKPTLAVGLVLGAVAGTMGMLLRPAPIVAPVGSQKTSDREGMADVDLYATVVLAEEMPPELMAKAVELFGRGSRSEVRAITCTVDAGLLSCWDGETTDEHGDAMPFSMDPEPIQAVLDAHREGLTLLRLNYNHMKNTPEDPTSVNIVGRYR